MDYAIVNGIIHTENDLIRNGYLIISNGNIKEINNGTYEGDLPTLSAEGHHVLPGFIDIHIHGGYGEDTMDASFDGLKYLSKKLLSEGTTSFLPTTMTQCNKNIELALSNIVSCQAVQDGKNSADILGVHLEGPFISPDKVGAQNPKYVQSISVEKIKHFQNIAKNQIKIITIAPEIKEADDIIQKLADEIIFSIGHTTSTFDQVNNFAELGVKHATHFYNACTGFDHRKPGLFGAVWTNKQLKAEIIVDGIHSHPNAIDIAYRLKGNKDLYLITDSMRAKGMSDGSYDLGGQNVNVKYPEARLNSGELAGSILCMIDGFKKLVEYTNASISDLWPLTSLNQAKLLNIDDITGSIKEGKVADIIIVDSNISLHTTIKGGVVHYK